MRWQPDSSSPASGKPGAVHANRTKLLAPLRAPVERVFGARKLWYGYTRVRYRSLTRNAVQLGLLAIATNMRRAVALA